jgi:phospholipase C
MAGTQRIQHVVVLMLENRSFDHIFGYRPGVNGLSGSEFNLLEPTKPISDHNPAYYVSNGAPFAVPVGHGPGHSFADANVQQFNHRNGPARGFPAKNSGFVRSYQTELLFADRVRHATGAEIRVVMEAFAPGRLPSIDALADAFCVCDNWYSEVPGPTQPNRLYTHAATSAGFALNDWSHIFDFRTIYNNLQDAGCSWATYDFDQNEVREFSQVNKQKSCFRDFATSFASDVLSGKLPNYSFVIPRFFSRDYPANSQHPPHDARYGDNLIADVYDALRANNDVWQKSALIVVYDEHGGLYDHVIPPSEGIPNPDGINAPPPGVTASWAPQFNFDRLGLRVPAIIASPWVAKGRVDSTRYQHTSVLATLKALFGLGSFLTKRDASANSFESLFSELSAPRTDTPETLPRAAPPAVTVSREDPAHPANQPMDATQTEIFMGVQQMLRAADPQIVSGADLHMTQGDASTFVRWAYDHMSKLAKTDGEFQLYRSRGKHHWRLCDAKGKVLAEAPTGYARRAAALAAIKHLQAAASGATIDHEEH